MADAGEIKAKVVIEYDGSGLDQAKSDLEKLGDLAGSFGSGGEGSIGDALAAMGEQAAEATKALVPFADAAGGLAEPLATGEAAVSELNDTLGEHGQALLDTAEAYKALPEPIAATARQLQAASEPIALIAERAQSMNEQLGYAGDGVAQIQQALDPQMLLQAASGYQALPAPLEEYAKQLQAAVEPTANIVDSTAQILPLLPQVAGGFDIAQQNVQAFSEAFDPKQFGLDTFAENMNVFQDALQNPTPFSMIGQYLKETGQTWDDFNSSIGEGNVASLDYMAAYGGGTYQALGGVSSGFDQASKSANSFTGNVQATQAAMDEFNQADPWVGVAASANDASKAVEGVGAATENVNKAVGETSGIFGGIFGEGGVLSGVSEGVGGFFGSIGNAFGGLMMGLDSIARPLFAVQMLGQMASGFGSWLYNANLAAEGSNASNPASFTSQVNQLGAGVSQGGNQFAVGFGAGLNPSINAWNNQANQGGGGSDLLGGIGKFLGGAVGGGGDILQVLGGSLLAGLSFGNAGMMQTGTNWENAGMQGLVNMYDAANGLPLQYPGTTGPYGGYTPVGRFQQMALSDWSTQPGGMTSAQQNVAADWAYFNSMPQGAAPSGPVVGSRYTLSGPDAYTQPQGLSGAMQDIGNFFSGLGKDFMHIWDPTGDLNNLGYGGASGDFGGGCFIAGTRVLMADGSEKPIEQLQIGEKVLAHNGIDEVITTVLARLTPPERRVYELRFSDGRTLTTTDSHPIATPLQGWKAISPINARRENPDLPISLLQEGDSILTFYGTCTLVSIQKKQIEQIYNITVGEPHTFYANGVLVHNKVAFAGGAQSFGDQGGFQLPHIDMGTIASNIASQFSGIQLPHLDLGGIASSLGGAFSGIQLPHLDLGGIASSLGGAFSGLQLPHLDLGGIASSLSGAFSGIQLPHLDLGGIGAALSGAFSSITLPHIPDFGGMINGALSGMFSGITLPSIPNIGGMISGALGGMFSGITMPSIPDLGGMINGALGGMFSGIQLPSIPDIGGMINGAIGGIFSSVHMPQIPDFGSMINGAISGIFSSIHMPSIPGFASGIEGFSGGLAMVGEAGPELVSLPSGSSVYPLTTGAGVGNSSPISLGGGGGMGTANINVYLDSSMLIQTLGVSLMSSINVGMGKRSY